MAVGVSRGPVERHFGSDSYTAYHKSNLTDNVIGEYFTDILANYRVYNAVNGHCGSEPGKKIPTGKNANQYIYRRLCGKCAHKYGTGNGCFRVRVCQPGVQRNHSRVDTDANQHQYISEGVCLFERLHKNRTCFHIVPYNTREEQATAQYVVKQIARSGFV